MTDTWKPSEGLKRAEAVAAQIKDELAAAGIQLAPMYQWRMAQVIGGAIDDALGSVRGAVDHAAADVFRGTMTAWSSNSPNGQTAHFVVKKDEDVLNAAADEVVKGLTEMASEISDDMQETPPAGAIHAAEEAPKKRGRGRPPGKKKDKKAAKKVSTPDAAAATA